ncbi:MAG: FUN14 domain-containing protein [Candidatus Ozemobacteraceae bacterium]
MIQQTVMKTSRNVSFFSFFSFPFIVFTITSLFVASLLLGNATPAEAQTTSRGGSIRAGGVTTSQPVSPRATPPRVTPTPGPTSKTSVVPTAFAALPPEITYAVATLGFGGIAGWCVGFTLKKAAKLAALLVGLVFIAVQALAYKQFLSIDWNKIKGIVPERAIEEAYMGGMSLLTYNFPFAGAFVAGFFLGFRKG